MNRPLGIMTIICIITLNIVCIMALSQRDENIKLLHQLKQEAIEHGYAVEDDGVFKWREK